MEPHKTPASPTRSMWDGVSPKLTFWFGLIAGIAASGVLALILFFSLGISTSKTSTTTTPTTTNTAGTAPVTYGDVKAVSDDDNYRGDKNAKITLVEYSDLECPFCKQFHPTMQKVMEDYKGKVRWVYRHFPLSFHQNAQKESEASLCVNKLGGNDKFWSFVDKIYERTTANGTGFALTALGPLAKEVGVDQTKFQSCLDGGEMAATVDAQETDGTGAGATGTPTTFVVGEDGKTITAFPGAVPYDQIKTALDAALAA